jgi:hypothetical protein
MPYLGSTWYNPDYYKSERGQAELAQAEQSRRATKARELTSNLEQQTQVVQRGSHMVTAGERQAAQVANQAAAGLTPLYEAGLLGEQDLGKAIASAVNDQQDRYQNLAAINADAEAIMQLSSPAQMKQAADELIKKKGAGAVMRTPAGQRLFGASEKIKEQRVNSMQSYADKHFGGNPELVTWDTDRNKPVMDIEAIRAESAYQTLQYHREAPKREALDSLQKALTPYAPKLSDFKDTMGNPDYERYEKAQAGYYQQQLELSGAYSDPDKLQGILQRRTLQASGVDPLQAAAQKFITTTPVDPQKKLARINAGLDEPGWYIGLNGEAVHITPDGE